MLEIQGATNAWKAALPNVRALVGQAARALFKAEHILADVTIRLADDAEVRALNASYRGKDKPTNVLSFPSGEWDPNFPSRAGAYLGDIILARETILREAAEQGKSPAHHLQHLVVHGLLHLLGHDHEEEEPAEAMEAKEIAILASIGLANPYR